MYKRQDLFIVNRKLYDRKNYKKIGFYDTKRNYYVIDLQALRQLMLEECHKKMTARNLNEGLKSLKLIGCHYCFRAIIKEYYANLTGLYVDKLIALAYPNGIPDAPNDELEPIEETLNEKIKLTEDISTDLNYNVLELDELDDEDCENESTFKNLDISHIYDDKPIEEALKELENEIDKIDKIYKKSN